MTAIAETAELTHVLYWPGCRLILLSRMLLKSYNHRLTGLHATLCLSELNASVNQQLQQKLIGLCGCSAVMGGWAPRRWSPAALGMLWLSSTWELRTWGLQSFCRVLQPSESSQRLHCMCAPEWVKGRGGTNAMDRFVLLCPGTW